MQKPDIPVPKKSFVEDPMPRVQMNGSSAAPKTADDAATALASKIPASGARIVKGHPGDPFIVVKSDLILDCLKFLRDDGEYLCQNLVVIGATDFLKKEASEGRPAEEPRIEVVYILYSYRHRFQLTLKTILPRENPTLASVTSLYRAANWYERECYDMLGVAFEGHPNLKRILTSPDWVGHPLRRDYVFPEEYNGMKVPL
jgi:NADH-quinone oxidoreductase subunit C